MPVVGLGMISATVLGGEDLQGLALRADRDVIEREAVGRAGYRDLLFVKILSSISGVTEP